MDWMLVLADKVENVLPVGIMVASFLAAIPLAVVGKFGSSLYWFSAGLLNCAVIFLVGRFG